MLEMATNPPASPTPQPQSDQVAEAILKQIEYYFSRQNLANDAYLVAQMDSGMWVPVEIIAGFKKVSLLTTDTNFILQVMAKSTTVTVDLQTKKLKASWNFTPLERNTIILREVPAGTTAEEIKALFQEKFPTAEVRNDFGDTWFVSLGSENNALEALLWVRSQKIKGSDVKARMKSEHPLKAASPPFVPSSSYPLYTPVPWISPDINNRQHYTPHPNNHATQFPLPTPPGGPILQGQGQGPNPYYTHHRHPKSRNYEPRHQNYDGGQRHQNYDNGPRNQNYEGGQQRGGQQNYDGQRGHVNQNYDQPRHQNSAGAEVGSRHQNSDSRNQNSSEPRHQNLDLRHQAFDFKKFTKSDVLQIIQKVQNFTTTEILPGAKDSGVVVSTPNTILEISLVEKTRDAISPPLVQPTK